MNSNRRYFGYVYISIFITYFYENILHSHLGRWQQSCLYLTLIYNREEKVLIFLVLSFSDSDTPLALESLF